MKNKKEKILVLIPHGGYKVPVELQEYTVLEKEDIFFEADTGAIELFSFPAGVAAYLHTDISRLFVDLDRPYTALKSSSAAVMNRMTSRKRDIFLPGHFPDEIALSNILKRHYFPFHDAAKKIIATGDVKLILDCHTVSASSTEDGEPRPLFTVQNRIPGRPDSETCAPEEMALYLIDTLKKKFSREKGTVGEKFSLNEPLFESHIMEQLRSTGIPVMRLSVSRTLFLNEQHFSYEYLKIDELRLKDLRDRLWECIKETVEAF